MFKDWQQPVIVWTIVSYDIYYVPNLLITSGASSARSF